MVYNFLQKKKREINNIQALKLLNGLLEIDKSKFPIINYLTIFDEELLEYKILHLHKMSGGTLSTVAINIEHDLACLGANDDLQIARDWLKKYTKDDNSGYVLKGDNIYHFN